MAKLSIDPHRRRTPRSPRLWLALAAAALVMYLGDCLHLLWQVDHLWAIPLAVLLGHLSFAFSLGISRLSIRDGLSGLRATLLFFYRPYGGWTLLFYALLSLAEELFFRAVPLSILPHTWWVVVLLAVGFSLIHIYPGRKGFPLMMLIDFFLFGVGLGAFFIWVGDLWPLVIIHTIRNGSVAKVLVRRDRLEAYRAEKEREKAERAARKAEQPMTKKDVNRKTGRNR